jgi:hypothetical protein
MTTDTSSTTKWHLCPAAAKRTDEAVRRLPRLIAALEPWIAKHPVWLSSHHTEDEEPAIVIRCDVAAALCSAAEWGGRELRAALEDRGWPVDDDLQHLVHAWSCREKREDLAAWQRRKDEARARRAARRRRFA